jgi:hypothetical protein
MRLMIFMVILFCFSCSSSSTNIIKDKYVAMNDLWDKKASVEEVKEIFGPDFKNVESGIIYTFANSKFPELGFFFDASNKLRGQFAYIDPTSLERLKQAIKCDWQETEEKRSIAHYTRTIKKGFCQDSSISYETYPDLNAYEVRWK